MLIVQSLDVDLPLCAKPKCRNSRKPSVQLDWFRLVQGPMNRLRFGQLKMKKQIQGAKSYFNHHLNVMAHELNFGFQLVYILTVGHGELACQHQIGAVSVSVLVQFKSSDIRLHIDRGPLFGLPSD